MPSSYYPTRRSASRLRDLHAWGIDTRREVNHTTGARRERQFETFSWAAAPASREADTPRAREPTQQEWAAYAQLCSQNVTCFHELEEKHAINFFEQRDVCPYCGAERLTVMKQTQCCQGGSLVNEDRHLPERLLALINHHAARTLKAVARGK